ncbi:TcfC E-set like domain-containing protein [Photobacterium leiognathi]|uniref:TcfC E-set like domain-containing protein n=1 Tax=Photobacterium leiognathi TaxID=553611 RepID=UPI002981FCC9|nr:TcfC E-set like domain-containing protein [Photobacterium leiognathi]
MKKVNCIFSLLLLMGVSSYSLAENIPDEFARFFETKEQEVEVVISGEVNSEKVQAIINFDSFTLINSTSNEAILFDYLIGSRLKKSAASQIIDQLLAGVESDSSCEGDVESCVPADIPEQAEYIFDYDNNRLRIYVSSTMLDSRSENVEYYSGDRVDNALINNTNLYLQTTDNNSSFSWENDTILGLPYGYFRANTQYQSKQNKVEVYDAFYNVDYENKRLKFGYQGNGSNSSFNATDYLFSDMSQKGKYISFGSSSNLLKRKSEGIQRLNFFAPQSGKLEVFRGDRMIITRGVQEGEHAVRYNELPTGAYDIKLVLRRGDTIIFEEQRFVVNTSNYSLAVDDYDYKLDFRIIEPSSAEDKHLLGSIGVGSAAISYRVSESVLLSSGLGGNQDEQFVQFGISKIFSDSINVDYVSNYFMSGATYQQMAARLYDFSVSFRYFNSDDSESIDGFEKSLATTLYGEDDRSEYSINWSGFILNGNINLGLSHYNYSENKQSSNVLSFSWSRPVFGGELSLSGNYNKFANSDVFNGLVSWSYDIGGDYRTSTSSSFNALGLSSVRSDVSRSIYSDNWNANGSLAIITNSTDTYGELSMMGSAHMDRFNYNGYAYGTSSGEYSFSGSMQGTQFITANHSGMTSKRSNSFILIEPQWQEKEKGGELGYTVVKDSRIWRTNTLKESEIALLDVSDYAEIDVRLDAEYQNLEIENNEDKKMTMPGSVYVIGGKVTQLQSQVLVMSDMFGQPIHSANCIGLGCRSFETVSEDGVFRVSYLNSQPFKIVSNNRLCVYDTKAMGQPYLKSYCLDGLDELPSEMMAITDGKENNAETNIQDKFVYIGKYKSAPDVSSILSRLKEVNLISHNVKVGDELYVYVKREEEYSIAQRHILDSLEAYAINDEASDEEKEV